MPSLKMAVFTGETVITKEIHADMQAKAAEKRRELIEAVSDVDDQLAEAFLSDEPILSADLDAAICRTTIERNLYQYLWVVHLKTREYKHFWMVFFGIYLVHLKLTILALKLCRSPKVTKLPTFTVPHCRLGVCKQLSLYTLGFCCTDEYLLLCPKHESQKFPSERKLEARKQDFQKKYQLLTF